MSAAGLITVDEALTRVLALAKPLGTQDIDIEDAAGRVLALPAAARLTQPPFDAAAMDGYALRRDDLPGTLTVIGTAAAGAPFPGRVGPGQAVRILTGAAVPDGADTVVMQENATRSGDAVDIPHAFPGKTHIRPRGNDFSQGDELAPGRVLRAADLALLAAMNVPRVSVSRPPRVAVLAGGDELVRPGTTPGPGQIVSSNDIAVAALARAAGAEVRILPLARDTRASLTESFAKAEGCDILVTIGGASVGDHDLVADVAGRAGVTLDFHRIAMRPGKPLMAGRMGEAAMLGLPGNPVSAMVCAILFLQPLIRAMQGAPVAPPRIRAELACPIGPEGDRQHYLRAKLQPGDGLPRIAPFSDQDSARLSIMADADALMIRPAGDPARGEGHIVEAILLRD